MPGLLPAVDRVDSAGSQRPVVEAAERHDADYSVTVRLTPRTS
ncbi:MAG TPA: hypothetical protein VIM19_19660 [Actinomycetes bacterium]